MKWQHLTIFCLTLFLVLISTIVSAENKINTSDCTFKGKKLYGTVQFVDSFPDVKVEIVTSFPDLKVKYVNSFPDQCGLWKKVDSAPDLKVQIVTSFPDIKIAIVDAFPGLP